MIESRHDIHLRFTNNERPENREERKPKVKG